MIPDHLVRQIFNECQGSLAPYWQDTSIGKTSQFRRGITALLWKGANPAGCHHYMTLFNTFNIIPKFCFDCYKVNIKPRTVLELFKLMILFDGVQLPNDNTRKCRIELRPEILDAYTGIVYCQSLDEAKEVLVIFQNLVSKEISPNIPVTLHRGCIEYATAYPEYHVYDKMGNPIMEYRDKWQEYENRADKKHPINIETFNHQGFNLEDSRIMLSWLKYAVAIGDPSYLKITKIPIIKLHGPRLDARPPFQPPEDV